MSQKTFNVTCPHCEEEYVIVEPETESESGQATPSSTVQKPMSAKLRHAEQIANTDPYTGSDVEIDVEQRVKADIEIDDTEYSFTFWYTPNYDYFTYVVRGVLETGQKSKDAFEAQDGRLYFKNRGVPWDSDKQWTYLTEEECQHRAELAGLGEVTPDEDNEHSNRFRIYLGIDPQPLVNENGEVAEQVLVTLAKGLIVFQTKQ